MAYGPYNFPSANPIWGLNAYTTLPDVIVRSYQEDQDALGAAIVPSDTVALANVVSEIILGSAGTLSVILDSGVSLLLPTLAAGIVHRFPFRIAQIKATGTTAAGIVGIG
jgi:hypothetical protein